MLYAFGSNGSGQLGVGHTEDLTKPEPTSIGNDAVHGQIKQLAAGGNHTVILYEDGAIRATGNNEDGRYGISDVQSYATFADVEPPFDRDGRPLKVKQIAATWSATIILCEDGQLYARGTGNSGELGLGKDIENTPDWRQISPSLFESAIVHISSSMAHTVAVSSSGDVYGWGKGRKGQLGEPAQDIWTPRKIANVNFSATRAVCGKDFTLIVGEPSVGQFVVLGSGDSDRFGIKANAPCDIAGWVDVATSWCSIHVLKAPGEIVAWGRNDHGQLGPPDLPEIEDLAAGSEHCLALTRSGKVLAWGWGEHGNCGLPTDDRGDVKGRWNEVQIPGRVTRVFAGCATSFVLTEDDGIGG